MSSMSDEPNSWLTARTCSLSSRSSSCAQRTLSSMFCLWRYSLSFCRRVTDCCNVATWRTRTEKRETITEHTTPKKTYEKANYMFIRWCLGMCEAPLCWVCSFLLSVQCESSLVSQISALTPSILLQSCHAHYKPQQKRLTDNQSYIS